MLALAFGIIALVAFLFLSRLYVAADPTRVAQRLRLAGALGGFAGGVLLIMVGRPGFGIALLTLASGLLTTFLRGRSVEADLDGRAAGGREDLNQGAGARRRNPPRQGAMTENEAYEVLGLDARARPEDIRRAHRALMKKVHPDQGGSDWLASRINQARDILLRTRR